MQLKSVFLLLYIFTNFSCSSQSEAGEDDEEPLNFKELLVAIREEKIDSQTAELEFKRIINELHSIYMPAEYDSLAMNLVFPLRTKNYKSVGGRGRGFYARHFNLFDHSVAKSHPAHDIFIYDVNRDCKDDNTDEYVDVVSVNDGVVIATETEWTEEMGYKGGNYVWVLDFKSGGLWYYAHQRVVYVKEGQIVEQGDKIGEVGRSGFNAERNRSDTHLHLMFLKIDKAGNPTPVNHYPWLKKAKTVYETHLPEHRPRKVIDAAPLPGMKPMLHVNALRLPSI
ncbi:M23 family metallopeptidase [Jiulongibacter sp. NS-SX5]|uniref:M23 family metallopeptidase n=1 Tax=Jiulongibacter sp. NS-SX5 TaxID=3463854 RepID=UPI0040587FF4